MLSETDFPAHPPPCYTAALPTADSHPYRFRQEGCLGSAMRPQSAHVSVTEIKRKVASSPRAHRDPHSSAHPLFDCFVWNHFQGAKSLAKVSLALFLNANFLHVFCSIQKRDEFEVEQ